MLTAKSAGITSTIAPKDLTITRGANPSGTIDPIDSFFDLDAFLKSMSNDFTLNLGNTEPVDWEQFLDLAPVEPFSPNSADTPHSTESEQSAALDPSPELFDFNFDFDVALGIMHDPKDVPEPLPAYQPDHRGIDRTMQATFGMSYGDFGAMTGLGDTAATDLGLTALLDKFNSTPAPQDPVQPQPDLTQLYSSVDWSALKTVQPEQVSPRPTLKRKDSDTSAESGPAKRPRGRPPKDKSAKRPYRRQSKSGSTVPALVAGALSGTPPVANAALDEESDDEGRGAKNSFARPKSVVPEKYLKDGSAQTILCMTADTIQSFPTFEELLKFVSPELYLGAKEFGERIKENRDKAKDAAKKSRDEKRNKIESLEKTVEGLESKLSAMQGVLMGLVRKGLLTEAEVRALA